MDNNSLYPPGDSDFAPHRSAADALADEAFSQAVTMAAYGMNMLRGETSGLLVDRGHIRQVVNLLTVLCSTLIDTRDYRRNFDNSSLVNGAEDEDKETASSQTTARMEPKMQRVFLRDEAHRNLGCKSADLVLVLAVVVTLIAEVAHA
ncbi:hypothetical protein GGI17_001938 [Coemansia sp. S146]|nr:hypothetical protein GGI17_001938 [Coemansia sp. S146]